MAQTTRRRPMRVPSATIDAMKKNLEKRDQPRLKTQISVVSGKILDGKSVRTRLVGGLPKPLNVTCASMALKSAGAMNKLRNQGMYIMENKARSAAVTKTIVQERIVTSEFLTIRCDKGRMLRKKPTPLQMGKRILCDAGRVNRISHVQMLHLFQALMREPLSFLELRSRFGVSKQTIKTLVSNGHLTEVWGPKGVGVRFVLSDKGRIHFKELEGAAKYEPNVRKNAIIRLKQVTAL